MNSKIIAVILLVLGAAAALFANRPMSFNETTTHMSASSLSTVKSECLDKSALKALYGNWAKKAVWDELATNKNWGSIHRPDELLEAVFVDRQGEGGVSIHWHEGSGACIQLRGDALWARLDGIEGSSPGRWEGPFTFIGTDEDVSVAYFRRIFGDHCYHVADERWCFGDGVIRINERPMKATLLLDGSEVPEYGTPLQFAGSQDLYMFVPKDSGWLVFKDTWASDENRTPVEVGTTQPWKVLTSERASVDLDRQ